MSFRILRVLSIGIVLSAAQVHAMQIPLPIRVAGIYYAGHWVNVISKLSGNTLAYEMLGLNKIGDGSIAKIASLDLKLVGHAIAKELLTNPNLFPSSLQIPVLNIKEPVKMLAPDLTDSKTITAKDDTTEVTAKTEIATEPVIDLALIAHCVLLNKAYDAGLKYLTLWEFSQRIVGIGRAWEKMHRKPLQIGENGQPTSTTLHDTPDHNQSNATTTQIPKMSDEEISWHNFPSIKDEDPLAVSKALSLSIYYGHPLEDIANWATKWAMEIYDDQQTALAAALHFIVSYIIVEEVTRKIGDATRIMFANNGAPMLNQPIYARTIKVGAGMAASHIFQKPIMNFMKDSLSKVGLYNPEAKEINQLAYQAAYKAPFAREAIKAHVALVKEISVYVAPFVLALRGYVPRKVLAAAALTATAAIVYGMAMTYLPPMFTAETPLKEEL